MAFHIKGTLYPLVVCILNRKKGFRFVVEYYLLLPSVSLQSTANLPDLGKTMYSMYSKHGFPSVTLWGQKACPIFSFTWDCSKQLDHEHHHEKKGIKHWLIDVSVQKKGCLMTDSWCVNIQIVEKNDRWYLKRHFYQEKTIHKRSSNFEPY